MKMMRVPPECNSPSQAKQSKLTIVSSFEAE